MKRIIILFVISAILVSCKSAESAQHGKPGVLEGRLLIIYPGTPTGDKVLSIRIFNTLKDYFNQRNGVEVIDNFSYNQALVTLGYFVDDRTVDTAVSELPQYQENGRFSASLYRNLSAAERRAVWYETRRLVSVTELYITSNDIDDDVKTFVGRSLDADYVVSGSLSTHKDGYIFDVAIFNAHSNTVIFSDQCTVGNTENMTTAIAAFLKNINL